MGCCSKQCRRSASALFCDGGCEIRVRLESATQVEARRGTVSRHLLRRHAAPSAYPPTRRLCTRETRPVLTVCQRDTRERTGPRLAFKAFPISTNNRGIQMLFALLIVLAIAFALTQPAPCTRKRSVSHATSHRCAGMCIQVRWRICTGVGYAR